MRTSSRRFLAILTAGALFASSTTVFAAGQRSFDTADAAVAALVAAAKSGDKATAKSLFGSEAEEVLSSGDPIADREAREGFVERIAEGTHLQHVGDDFAVLSVGNDYWPFAIPLVRDKSGWFFDTAAGKTELLNRRIGRNELYTIDVCQEYVVAQRDFARRQKAVNGYAEYAQRVHSTPGHKDGLYWEAKSGEMESPIGPLLASATHEGYGAVGKSGQPFHGYLYKTLPKAGPNAPGGAHTYVEGGRMTRGFALLAYPVRYGASGVMTFQVNEQGIVFQKDLGPKTAEIAGAMTAYDPDDSWDPTE